MGMAAILTGQAIFVWLAVILLTLFLVGWLSAKLLPGQSSDFILELPPVRRPRLGGMVVKTIARMEWYLKEVLPLFLLGTVILFVFNAAGWLTTVEQLMAPVVQGVLGLPPEVAGVFLIGFLRRDFGAAGLFLLAREGALTANQLLVSLIVITLFMPCIANLFMIVREHGRRTALYVALFVFPFAFAVGGVVNYALQFLGIEF
jgi:ferrous iron transport protein B